MRMIYHALNPRNPLYERQWLQSVRSIRLYNQTIPIYLYLFGVENPSIIAECKRHNIVLINTMIPTLNLPPFVTNLLNQYPVMHKFVPLLLIPNNIITQVLYLDCDTYLFDDVDILFERYKDRQFYAREEPNTRRSTGNPLVDDHMARLAAQDGLAFVPPYNMGVCLFNHGLWAQLGGLIETFYTNTYRFMMDLWAHGETRFDARVPYGTPLAYPLAGMEAYIVEQVALWYTWGNVDFTHGIFARSDLNQSAEEYIGRKTKPLLAHYYHLSEDLFFQQVARLT